MKSKPGASFSPVILRPQFHAHQLFVLDVFFVHPFFHCFVGQPHGVTVVLFESMRSSEDLEEGDNWVTYGSAFSDDDTGESPVNN